MILIGSAPLLIAEGLPVREYDIIANEEERALFSDTDIRIDFQDPDFLNNAEVEERFSAGHADIGGVSVPMCSLRGLAAIKRSHIFRDRFFDKHIGTYHKRLVEHRNPADETWIQERTRLTREAIRQPNPNLAQSNEDFFDDAVKKEYDHDYLHEVVAYGDSPVYTQMKRDHSQAWCERDMWDQFPHELKLQCVAEETYVIATERFMVPNKWNYSPARAYFKALQKVCTTLTSGWFRDFALDNYPRIAQMYDKNKFTRIKETLT